MKKINILEMEISTGWGGQEKRTIRLINNLDKKRFNIFYVAQPNSNIVKNKKEIMATLIPLKMRQSYDIKAIYNLCKIVKERKIDIISTHSGKDAWLGAIVGIIMNKKVVRVRHLQTPINSILSYNMSTKVVTVSKQVEKYLKQKGVKKEKLQTIYTGIDTNKFYPQTTDILRNELKLEKETIIIGIVAVLRGAKRHKDLIEAISKIDAKVKLIIVGDGPQLENIQKIIKEKNLQDKVIMLGHREDIDQILPSFDIFVLPSNMEALGTSILEASACAIPCVGSRVGGIPECIIDNKTGFLFENQNVNELKNVLEKLIFDKNLREEFGKNARILIEKTFSVKAMVIQTQNLYEELAK
ncbi:MAG TPA: glycosyltransferase family 1 protein [Arcobacter sp.]|nr:glycosyltransferase family 1 protein [Arcobacter sp.]